MDTLQRHGVTQIQRDFSQCLLAVKLLHVEIENVVTLIDLVIELPSSGIASSFVLRRLWGLLLALADFLLLLPRAVALIDWAFFFDLLGHAEVLHFSKPLMRSNRPVACASRLVASDVT